MNPEDPLTNLHPLRVPAEIGWWPLAPGWWLLICAALVLFAALAYCYYRYRQRNAYRRMALARLTAIGKVEDQHTYLNQINALLKSVAIHAFPRQDIAALSGDAWLAFLNNSARAKNSALFPQAFATAVYSPTPEVLDRDQLSQACRLWICKHRVTS